MNAEQQNSLSPFYIMMRGVPHSQLSGILDFMYYGEANVAQEDLDQFLALAEELQVSFFLLENIHFLFPKVFKKIMSRLR